MRKLGQHFLKNTRDAQVAVDGLSIENNDFVLEIGPGRGALTIPLFETALKMNARLAAIEKDRALIQGLRDTFPKVDVIEGDALKILPEIIEKMGKVGNPAEFRYRIIGNIPYYITGKFFRVLGDLDPRPQKTVIMVQKEVAERVSADPGDMNRLAASVQFWAIPKIIARIPRNEFIPPPKVDSALVSLTPKGPTTLEKDAYYRAVRMIFAQPRKTIANNIAFFTKDTKEQIEASLYNIGINPSSRAESLSVEQIGAIAEEIKRYSLA